MKSLFVILAGLILSTSAPAWGYDVTTTLVHLTPFAIRCTAVHPEHANELFALASFSQLSGPAQIHNDSRYRRVRTLTVSATSLNFGTVTLNSASTRSITLQSTGSASVTVNALSVASAGFAVAGPALPLTLNPGQTATLQVSFDPTVTGVEAGSLSIASNSSSGSTTTVSLSGTGATTTATPILSLSTSSLNFGSIAVGTAATQSVTLTSTGSSAVTVSAASLVGTGFTISGVSFPVTLNPTIAVTLEVHFDPTATGTATGTLTFTSNSSTGTSVVMLTGSATAVQHQVTLNWAAPTNSPVPVSGYNVYRAATGSTSFQILNTSIDMQTSYMDENLIAGSSYSYYVKSVDSTGVESTASNQVSVTIP